MGSDGTMQKKVLVAGGAGFLGAHLCELLIEQGYSVICVDNLSTGSYDNIIEMEKDPHFCFVEKSIEEPLNIKVDEIYNLACPASPLHYQKNPIGTLKTNFLGVLHLLELADDNCAKILQTSTSEIYGNPQVHPQVENYYGNVNPIGIRACYDEGKRVAETLFFDFWRKHKTRIKLVRIFNTYGPKMQNNDGRVVSNFILQALKNKDITIYGDGMQTRSFCYVDDMIRGLCAMMNSGEGCIGPINLGNPQEISIKELAEKIVALTGSASQISFCDIPEDDPVRRRPDISIAKEKLKWEPYVSLERGLQATIKYFEKEQN